MKTISYYKSLLKQANESRSAIEAAEAKYKREYDYEMEQLESGMVGQEGFNAHVAEAGQKRDLAIENALSMIDDVTGRYSAMMDDMAKLDGSRIDDNTMRILNSGMQLSTRDWQELADRHMDDALMSRILQERYQANPPQDLKEARKNNQSGIFTRDKKDVSPVVFGQSPAERKKIFTSFSNLIRNSCKSGTFLDEYADRDSYWNYLAMESIQKMKPFSDESFDNVNEEFPFEYVESTPTIF